MSTATRLAKVEGTLSPKEATLAWLAEAHQFPTLTAYVGWLVTQPPEAAPFWRVPEQAERAVRASMRGQPRDVVEATAHQAVRDAVFLVELVIRLNVDAAELVRTEALRATLLAWEARTRDTEIASAPGTVGPRGARADNLRRSAWMGSMADAARVLHATDAARVRLEHRYLDGRDALFPDATAAWRTLRGQFEHLTGLTSGAASSERRARLHTRPAASHPSQRLAGSDALAADIAASALGRTRFGTWSLMGDTTAMRAGTAAILRNRER